ncbi:MAG TPA: thiolase family protein [Candidatus Manganitrophaceae bacterium]|nr:thiolase family protein [Candidatus Manganitrophaceae bacterium]
MSKKVAILGYGTTPFRARWIDKTYYELAFDAAKAALEDAGLDHGQIESAVYGIYNELFERQFMPDVYVHDYLGLGLKPSVRVATGGATGGAAVHTGFAQVASGLYDIVLVLGVEKCSDAYNPELKSSTPEVLKGIIYSADMTFEAPLGLTPAASYALPTVAHMEKYGSPTEVQMAKVSVKNHKNAFNNPYAQRPEKITIDDVLNSKKICHPFKFYDNCLYSEGASAMILVSEKFAKRSKRPVGWLTGLGAATDMAFTGNRPDYSQFGSSIAAGKAAYKMAKIKNPVKELDFAELHDAFTAAEILSYEAFGFCKPGDGGKLIDDGVTEMEGALPVSPSGGLIGCGHAVGATGVMQVGEAFLQVTGQAGKRQVKGAKKGLVQSIGGPATSWTFAFIVEG